ncbi:RNA polymerase II holoenzyme cyclin-like subunit [Terfezia claveryi]|nr:RNA polymerase II holoenzyme cyclin-like subunit [Terfezia claveryi]
MAANYWASSQRQHWQFTRERLAEIRSKLDDSDKDAVKLFPLPERRHLSIYFNIQIVRLGRRMQIRQQALATAQLYLRRFYTKVPIRDTNPYLVLATCVYLACKMEECPQHIRVVAGEARTFWPEFITGEIGKLAECEFWVISEMNSFLIVHHPYRTLQDLGPQLQLTPEETSQSWNVINDSYLTDLPMLYPPHIIALTAIFLSVVLKASLHATTSSAAAAAVAAATSGSGGNLSSGPGVQSRTVMLIEWYAESGIDMDSIIECTQEIISLYEVWDNSAEKVCKDQLGRMIKQRGLS